tara:strand:- start:274 stop:393 length:120 start_codon:yes stop_codon:yes gene_type:complete
MANIHAIRHDTLTLGEWKKARQAEYLRMEKELEDKKAKK